jgi:nucleoside-diphosphate-sugar epimerase
MKIFVTGATGFLGRSIVSVALERGHFVRAVARAASDPSRLPWADSPNAELAQVDLRSRGGLAEALAGIDVVIHAAAAKSGDLYAQLAGTVLTTENLIAAMDQAGVKRIVGISTFSIYDYSRIASHSKLDETSPVIGDTAFDRDYYAQTKLIQERLLLDQKHAGWQVTILRPGVIYGKDNTWTARLGAGGSGRWWIRMGALARLPLTYVENCAEAIVLAAENDSAVGKILNVVDDNPPTQHQYARALRRRMLFKSRTIFIPWPIIRLLGICAMATNKILFRGHAKLPSVLIPSRLEARFKPLRFDNRQIKQTLNWTPRYGLAEALDRSFISVAATPTLQPILAGNS